MQVELSTIQHRDTYKTIRYLINNKVVSKRKYEDTEAFINAIRKKDHWANCITTKTPSGNYKHTTIY